MFVEGQKFRKRWVKHIFSLKWLNYSNHWSNSCRSQYYYCDKYFVAKSFNTCLQSLLNWIAKIWFISWVNFLFIKINRWLNCLTPTLSVWPLRNPMALKSILCENLFLDQLHDVSFLSSNSFFHSFLISKFMKENSLTQKNYCQDDFHYWTFKKLKVNHVTSCSQLA